MNGDTPTDERFDDALLSLKHETRTSKYAKRTGSIFLMDYEVSLKLVLLTLLPSDRLCNKRHSQCSALARLNGRGRLSEKRMMRLFS